MWTSCEKEGREMGGKIDVEGEEVGVNDESAMMEAVLLDEDDEVIVRLSEEKTPLNYILFDVSLYTSCVLSL